MNDKHDGCKNKANTTSKLNTDQEGREESQTPLQEERGPYPQQETRDSLETWESCYQRIDTGTSQRQKKSGSTYGKQPNSETRTKERYRRQATPTTRFKASKETWTKEKRK